MGIHDRDYMKKRREEDDDWTGASTSDAEDRASQILEKYPRLPWIVISLVGLLGIVALLLSGRR